MDRPQLFAGRRVGVILAEGRTGAQQSQDERNGEQVLHDNLYTLYIRRLAALAQGRLVWKIEIAARDPTQGVRHRSDP